MNEMERWKKKRQTNSTYKSSSTKRSSTGRFNSKTHLPKLIEPARCGYLRNVKWEIDWFNLYFNRIKWFGKESKEMPCGSKSIQIKSSLASICQTWFQLSHSIYLTCVSAYVHVCMCVCVMFPLYHYGYYRLNHHNNFFYL